MAELTREEKQLLQEKEEFLNWLEHPVTRKLRRVLQTWREAERDKWESGDYICESKDGLVQLNAGGVARCKVLKEILDLNHETLEAEIDSAEHERTGTQGPSGPG